LIVAEDLDLKPVEQALGDVEEDEDDDDAEDNGHVNVEPEAEQGQKVDLAHHGKVGRRVVLQQKQKVVAEREREAAEHSRERFFSFQKIPQLYQ